MGNRCPKCDTDNPSDSKFCKECATPLPGADEVSFTRTLETPVEILKRGSLFAGRYEIIEELGCGGMGKVFRVEDKNAKEEMALKLIKPEIASDKKTIARFRNELTTARKISQRNVCRMFDLGEDEGIHYITMEYVSGEDLKSLIIRIGRMPISKALDIGSQICGGLAEAHRLGIVHRDLKPGNIMIDKAGNAKIMDFGIARSGDTSKITGTGVVIGTPEYMSPEQAEADDLDPRSDIYSLGIILYEMVTGQVPFSGKSSLSVAMKQKGEQPKDPQEINPQVPDELSELILRCLEKDREMRFATADELKQALDEIIRLLPSIRTRKSQKKAQTSREVTVTFNPRKLLFPAFVVALVIALLMVIWHPWIKEKTIPLDPLGKPSIAVVYFENNTGDENLDHWRKGISDLLITDLTQSRYLKVLGGDKLFDILDQMDQLEAKSYSSKILKEVAVRGGVNHVARGSYSKAGEILRIDLVLQNARSGEPLATQKVEGRGEESIFSMVDELTKWTKTSLKLSAEQIASDLDEGVGDVTTNSPEAYKFYMEGRNLLNETEWQRSIESMEKAIALDPGFAMAFRSMAAASGQLGRPNERIRFLKKALELSNRLPEKERLLIQGDFYRREPALDKAIEAYEKLLILSPENTVANNNLGVLYNTIEEWDKSKECFEAAIKAETSFRMAYTNLAGTYMALGEYDRAKKALEDGINRHPEYGGGYFSLATLYAFQGQFDLALAEVDKAAALDPIYTKAQFYHLMWDLEKTEEEYKKWFTLSPKNVHLLARERLGCLYRTQGKFEEAKYQIRLGIDLAQIQKNQEYLAIFYYQLADLFRIAKNYEKALETLEKIEIAYAPETLRNIYNLELEGWIYTEIDELDKAKNTADELKKLVEASLYKKRIRHYHFLMGMIELKSEDYSEGFESIKNAISLLPNPFVLGMDHALYRYYYALAYFNSGNLQRAHDEFEGIIKFIPGRILYGDIYVMSYYMLGQIYEQQSDTAHAIENYERFLILWKDADSGLPEVEDAKKRLAGLKNC